LKAQKIGRPLKFSGSRFAKKVLLLILDSLGGTELLVILVVALVIFGPRKLPQLSRSLGRSLADFKRASQDFKETWEKEARLAADDLKEDHISRAMLPPEENQTIGQTVGRGSPFSADTETTGADVDNAATQAATAAAVPSPTSDVISASLVPPPSIRPMPVDSAMTQSNSGGGSSIPQHANNNDAEPHPANEQTRKQDWL
jgi:TatA/E family protein of Tat protein translocase